MEAKAKAQPSKPPEGVKWKAAAGNNDWRAKKKVTFVESDDEEETEQPVPEERVRETEKAPEVTRKPPGVDMPYRGVKPLNTGVRTQPGFNKDHTQANMGPGSGEKAYRIRAPIQRDGVTDEVIERIENTEVTVKLGDLYGISRELREGERLRLTKVRQPIPPKVPEVAAMQMEEVPLPTEELVDVPLAYDALDIAELPPVGVFVTTAAMGDMGDIPVGSMIAQDPYLQYLDSLPQGEEPKQVYVARDTAPLQVLYPVVNETATIESVLDSGSQIVSMASDLAKEIGLIWDPNLRIYMQSANGSMEQSVGLARNVRFRLGPMTMYLQVHIINKPAYKALLGRPFDLLTRSQIDHSVDGRPVITLTDPNTGKVCAMPTFDRGSGKSHQNNEGPTVESQGKKPDSASYVTRGFRSSSRN